MCLTPTDKLCQNSPAISPKINLTKKFFQNNNSLKPKSTKYTSKKHKRHCPLTTCMPFYIIPTRLHTHRQRVSNILCIPAIQYFLLYYSTFHFIPHTFHTYPTSLHPNVLPVVTRHSISSVSRSYSLSFHFRF